MKVVLDHETFHAENYSMLQAFADRVALDVDLLIPGAPKDYPETEIVCFEASETWGKDLAHPAPITLIGPKLLGEPLSTKGGLIRIAVFGVQPLYLRRFAYQLAHELAHVKMGAKTDNALIETFATSVSYEVLRKLALFDYLIPAVQGDIRNLPDQVQIALANGDIPGLKTYWQSQMASRWFVINDRPLQTLGALLMQMGNQPRWNLLLGIAQFALCTDAPGPSPMKLCQPDVQKMNAAGLHLDSLGY